MEMKDVEHDSLIDMMQDRDGSMEELSLKKLQDQVIVITGASSGIGLVTARMAAKKEPRLSLPQEMKMPFKSW